MPENLIEIDWCQRANQLRQVEQAILMGEMVTEARFGADMARYATAKLSDVRAAADDAMKKCMISRGEVPARTRFAIRGLMRPY